MFGAEMWVLLAPISQRSEGGHVGFLRQVKKLKTKKLRDGLWHKAAANKILQGSGTQPIQTYLDRRQATVAEWGDLRTIFDVCTMKMVYEV